MTGNSVLDNKLIIAGIDDATKCPCIGSIFVAGVVATQKIIKDWSALGVDDSKKLTRKKREKLARIIEQTALAYSVKEVTPAMIDDKSMNLNAWEMAIVLSIMHDLQLQASIDYAHVDNWEVSPILFWQRLKAIAGQNTAPLIGKQICYEHITRMQIIPEHRADEQYVVVGAASILAKNYSDLQYDQYRKQYGNFGSGNPGDPATRHFVWQHRHNPPPIIRKSWNTFKVLAPLERLEDDPLFIYRQNKKAAKTC